MTAQPCSMNNWFNFRATNTEDFFANVFEETLLRSCLIPFTMVAHLIWYASIAGIVWYERIGMDSYKRTLRNNLVFGMAIFTVASIILVFVPFGLRLQIGHRYPLWFCGLVSFFENFTGHMVSQFWLFMLINMLKAK